MMHERFAAVSAIQGFVVAGNLVAAKERAGQLVADGSLLTVAVDWAPYAENLHKQVQETSAAADLKSAASHMAAAARACGRCHEALGVDAIDHSAELAPIEDDDLHGIMRRHRWASDRMWEGLIGPSDESWQAGADALDKIIDNAQEKPVMQDDEEMRGILTSVGELAKEATTAQTAVDRQRIFGTLLSSCSSCHQKMQQTAD